MSLSPTSSLPFPVPRPSRWRVSSRSPMEKVLGEISGVEHIYSMSSPGLATLGVQFTVGEHRTEAIVRLYNAIYSNQDWRPANAGILPPLIKPKGIDDVPILTLTLWTQDRSAAAHELGQVARSIETEIKRVPGTRNVYTIGGVPRVGARAARSAAARWLRRDRRRICVGRCWPPTSCSTPAPSSVKIA